MLKKILPAIACTAALLMSGCAFNGSGVVSTSGSTSPLSKGNMGGVAHGGRQGIYNATVSLYAMNTSTATYGAAPTMFAQTTTLDTNGDFAFVKGLDGTLTPGSLPAWSCPSGASTGAPGSAADPYMYLIASGGDTTGTGSTANNNTFAKLMVVLGDCASITQGELVTINEMTTVGSIVALQQFFNPTTQAIGAPTTNVIGLTNAIKLANTDLVDIYHGEAQGCSAGACSSFTVPGSTVAGITITASPEQTKLNTMANILAACVSTSAATSVGCQALVTNAVSPNTATSGGVILGAANTNFPATPYPTVADTLQAIDYMVINPTESQDYGTTGKLNNLFALSTSNSPFQPALAAGSQPSDWTVGVSFAPSGTCTNVTATGTATGSLPISPPFITSGIAMAQDAGGNIWIGGSGGATASGASDVLAEVNSTGAAINCMNGSSVTGTATTAGRRIAVDSRGNIWYATNQGLLEYVTDTANTAVGTVLIWPNPTSSQTGNNTATPAVPVTATFTINAAGIVADKNGNIFTSPDALSAATTKAPAEVGYVYEYPGVATMSSPFTAQSSILQLGSLALSNTGGTYRDITVNANGTLITDGSGGNYVYAFTTTGYNTAATNVLNGYGDVKVVTTPNGGSTTYGMALLTDGSSVSGNTCCARAGGLYQVTNAPTPALGLSSGLFAGGQNADRNTIVDGANNVWTGGATYANDSAGTLNSIGESTGPNSANTALNFAAISPIGVVPNPACATSAGGCEVMGGFTKPANFNGLASTYGMAIDGSGNVWALPDSGTQNDYYMIVGQAVPVVGPIVQNIH